MKYTKDKLIEELLSHNTEVVKQMANIANSLQNINDSNLLHSKTIDDNTLSIKKMVEVNGSFLKMFRFILIIVVAALIILAGAEKVTKLLPFLN
jgi:hypothetical protein